MRLVSWNVNGIRAIAKKGFLDWLAVARPDVLCLQETRADADALPASLTHPPGYESYWARGERTGYCGVATYTTWPVTAWQAGFGVERFDREGRVLKTDLAAFELYNVYFPNGRASDERLAYKLDFYEAFLEHVDGRVRAGREVVFCGDINTAHRPIDLARPKANETSSGFLPIERAWLDRCLEHGWIDSFRLLHPDAAGAYSWWTMRTNARAQNVGWRLDAFFVSPGLRDRVIGAGLSPEVMGSDHCPVWLELAE